MLFNSFPFLFVFLPASLLIYYGASVFGAGVRLPTLLAISFVFYGYWDWRFVPLLVGSIAINWLISVIFISLQGRWLIAVAIIGNLGILAFFKYYNFFAGLFPWLEMPHLDIVLPLGISFFTFHHIMYLSDLKAGLAPRYSLIRYGLYIGFFPQILSGPLVRWREVMHQFDINPFGPGALERISRGLVLLTLGLCEKALMADSLARVSGPIFASSQNGIPSLSDAWLGTSSFMFQIYFDFAGYTDMALGVALMFGIVLPQNFNAPYRADSLQDFWRRWHMTLSRFLRDYLYIPLGGSRYGLAVQLWALFATMSLGGLWHGAGLSFVAWGILHGIGLGVGVLWRRAGLSLPAVISIPLTFLFVMLCWVLFHAPSFEAAGNMYEALVGYGSWRGGWPMQDRWLITFALLISVAFPGAWSLAQMEKPRLPWAMATGVLLAVAILVMNTGQTYDFIYFHF
jgi:alginate O-acetyltransferase complex protein AlgI